MVAQAREAKPGAYYRLTRDPGNTYFVLCTTTQRSALERRLHGKNCRSMKPDDRRLLQQLTLCRDQQHVLAIRYTRFLNDQGARREMRAYIALPPDYALREVANPPGYGPVKRAAETDDAP